MKRKICLIVLFYVFLLITSGCSIGNSLQSTSNIIPSLTTEEKLEDFEYMYSVIKENYPFLDVNKRLNNVDWLANRKKYIEMIKKTTTDIQYNNTLSLILDDLNNGHTHMLNSDFYHYAKAALETDKKSLEPWLRELNKPKAQLRYPAKQSKQSSSNSATQSANSNIRPNNVETKVIIDNKVAYIWIKSLNLFNIEPDMRVIKPFLQEVKSYNALIIDIRQNSGGSDSYWSANLVPMLLNQPLSYSKYYAFRGGSFQEDFLKAKLQDDYYTLQPANEIYKENINNYPTELKTSFKYYLKKESTIAPKDSIGFKGKIYLLVDRNVYSSSESFAAFAKSTGWATLVGETTGGDGIGMDPMFCTLPNSGYVFRFSMVMGLTSDGTCNEEFKTVPDIKVNAKKSAAAINDEAIQYVIDLNK